MESKLQERLACAWAERALLSYRKEGDEQVLGDEVLRAAVSGEKKLSRAEMTTLLDSPVTLRRMQMLEAERRLAVRKGKQAANDGVWQSSRGILLAANTGSAVSSINTDDGLWRLSFLRAGDGYNVVLQLNMEDQRAAAIHASGVGLAVWDGRDVMLMFGRLDADGELEQVWALADPPYQHMMVAGGRFTVNSV